MGPLRIIIADDDDTMRGALGEVLDADDRFTVVSVVSTGEELLDRAGALRPDLVLLDVRMPGGGAPAARALLAPPETHAAAGRRAPPLVVAVSAHTGTSVVVEMLRAGVTGYFAKGRLGALPDLLARCGSGEVVLAVPGAADALRQLVHTGPDEPGA
jgi:DNA-binding NarL/FixJ family response regulator